MKKISVVLFLASVVFFGCSHPVAKVIKTRKLTWYKEPFLQLSGEVGEILENGLCGVEHYSRYGLIDFEGNYQLKPIASEPVSKIGLIPVSNGYYTGLINQKGDTIYPCKANNFHYIGPSFYSLGSEESALIFKEDGSQLKTNCRLSYARGNFHDNMLAVEVWGDNKIRPDKTYIDTAGNRLPGKYRTTYNFQNGIAAVITEDNKHQYIDTKGNVVFDCPEEWTEAYSFEGPLAVISISGKGFGFINKQFDIIIEPQFSAILTPCNNLQVVSKTVDGKELVSAINSTGKTIIPFQFGYIKEFTEDKCIVTSAQSEREIKEGEVLEVETFQALNKEGVYDMQQELLIVPYQYDNLENAGNDILLAKTKGTYEYLYENGKPLSTMKFEKAGKFYKNRAWVKQNGKWGIIQLQ
ncbi:WG repeat-containing protein [Niastella sp. OAS944]|uniref:WG repeat-containing protein n=1 Tax=Niastella sp. OAS944 TaxID=2664089 RepID=UPI0034891C13|nr:hypothetical protein [Chitinophagaceae bacterium OAS944]